MLLAVVGYVALIAFWSWSRARERRAEARWLATLPLPVLQEELDARRRLIREAGARRVAQAPAQHPWEDQ